jgi:4-diphosphocytidyl-2-C-methyl-D-erythritol kinase
VAFAEIGDWLGYAPGPRLELDVEGPAALEAGPPEENLVLRAARALAARIPDLTLGRFRLVKRLPAAAGMGGGSSDAAAALAALAEATGLPEEDERLLAAASQTGADVPVCLFPKARMMSGIGERLGAPVALPEVFAVLANPRVPAPTRDVFEALGLAPGARLQPADEPAFVFGSTESATLGMLTSGRNDLEEAARRVAPAIGSALETLARLPGALAARMSGSGATCFALFDNALAAAAAHRLVVAEQPQWWVKATRLR